MINDAADIDPAQAFRDLHWAVASPCLLKNVGSEITTGCDAEPLTRWVREVDPDWSSKLALATFLAEQRLLRDRISHEKRLRQKANSPAENKDSSGLPLPPVGRYFEDLIQYYLESVQRLHILERGRQILSEGRTVGEIDFLYEDASKNVCHAEIAVKFFLFHPSPNTEEQSRFVGPNSRDNFESKTERLLEHQLPLSAVYFPDVRHRIAHVKGIIFYPAQGVMPSDLPRRLSPDHLKGTWLRSTTISQLASQNFDGARVLIRQKPYWLSDAVVQREHSAELLSVDDAIDAIRAHFRESSQPRMLSILRPQENVYEETDRLMVVDADWPN